MRGSYYARTFPATRRAARGAGYSGFLLTVSRLSVAQLRPIDYVGVIRLGREGDGGYVVPAPLVDRATLLLSIGMKQDWSFERAFVTRNRRARAITVDPGVGPGLFARQAGASAITLARHATRVFHRSMRGERARLRTSIDYFVFFSGRHRHVRKRLATTERDGDTTIPALLQLAGAASPHAAFLKMDIEGAEYDVVPQVAEAHAVFAALVLEFHTTSKKAERFAESLELLGPHFAIVHAHANNYAGIDPASGVPEAVEITFAHRALLSGSEPPSPHTYPRPGLDHPNSASRPDHALRFTGA